MSASKAVSAIATLMKNDPKHFSGVTCDGDHKSAEVFFTYGGNEFCLSSEDLQYEEDDDDDDEDEDDLYDDDDDDDDLDDDDDEEFI